MWIVLGLLGDLGPTSLGGHTNMLNMGPWTVWPSECSHAPTASTPLGDTLVLINGRI